MGADADTRRIAVRGWRLRARRFRVQHPGTTLQENDEAMAATPQSLTTPLPPMPGGPITGPDAWRADEVRERDDWVHVLNDTAIAEIDAAVEAADTGGRPIAGISREDFPLPTLGPVLDTIREELLRGRGFVLIRGLPIERYSVRRRAIAFWGIGAFLGRAVSQNAMGHLLGHVIDLGRTNDDYRARTYQTRDRQFFHADSCDVVGLLCIRKAKKGGLSAIVSSVTLYNEMLARSPELAAELFRPLHFDRRGEVPEGEPPWYEMPVFNWHEGRLSTHYVRRYIQSIRRLPEVPPLTERQIAAFDLLDEIAEDPGGPAPDGLRAGGHAVPPQPADPPRPHRFRGRRRPWRTPPSAQALALCAGRAGAAAGPTPGAGGAQRSATAAASWSRTPSPTCRSSP